MFVVHWIGRCCSIAPFNRPVARTKQLSYYRKLIFRMHGRTTQQGRLAPAKAAIDI